MMDTSDTNPGLLKGLVLGPYLFFHNMKKVKIAYIGFLAYGMISFGLGMLFSTSPESQITVQF